MQTACMQKEETSSNTAYMERIMLTSAIDAEEDRDVETIDIPNFFIQIPIDRMSIEKRKTMKRKGVLVDVLVQIDPEKYVPNVFCEKGNKLLYIKVLKAIYVILQSTILSYINQKEYFQTEGFIFNPYDTYVAINNIEVEPLTKVLHVYDVKVIQKGKRWYTTLNSGFSLCTEIQILAEEKSMHTCP